MLGKQPNRTKEDTKIKTKSSLVSRWTKQPDRKIKSPKQIKQSEIHPVPMSRVSENYQANSHNI